MEREGCVIRGRQQRSERESLSSCMTAVLAWYKKLFNGPVNTGMKTISALQTFYLTLPLPFLLLPPLYHIPSSLPHGLSGSGLVWQWYGFH